MSKRTVTIKMDEPLYRRLQDEAERRRTTKSSVLREAFERSVKEVPQGSLLERMEDLFDPDPTAPSDLSTNKKYMEGYGE